MSASKHEKRPNPKLDEDLKENPGIGQSKGSFATGIDPEEIEGENTVEGDTENNAGRFGQVKTGRERSNA
ncbi:MAG TPA: hypothetical protein VJ763_02785 [Sphingomicrobium sp.]|jgi:hypothetical protein|nr:hypothetical protein [Sphingomicrobium sp.]